VENDSRNNVDGMHSWHVAHLWLFAAAAAAAEGHTLERLDRDVILHTATHTICAQGKALPTMVTSTGAVANRITMKQTMDSKHAGCLEHSLRHFHMLLWPTDRA
jgi:hypothetical protein